MRNSSVPLAVAITCAAFASPALAGPYDNVFFVRKDATAVQMFADRDGCADIAKGVQIGRGEAYSDPDYGLLSAMGTAIDSDSMHGGIGKAVQRAALEKCMEKHGWVQQDPLGDDVKPVRRASLKSPAALDAWLKAHEPAPPKAEVAASAKPATQAPAEAPAPPKPAASAPPAPAPAQGGVPASASPNAPAPSPAIPPSAGGPQAGPQG